jgi:hypothetical protein
MESNFDSRHDIEVKLRAKLKETITDLLMYSDALNISSVVLTDIEEKISHKVPKVASNSIIYLSTFMDSGALSALGNFIQFYKSLISINPTDNIRKLYLQEIRKR